MCVWWYVYTDMYNYYYTCTHIWLWLYYIIELQRNEDVFKHIYLSQTWYYDMYLFSIHLLLSSIFVDWIFTIYIMLYPSLHPTVSISQIQILNLEEPIWFVFTYEPMNWRRNRECELKKNATYQALVHVATLRGHIRGVREVREELRSLQAGGLTPVSPACIFH